MEITIRKAGAGLIPPLPTAPPGIFLLAIALSFLPPWAACAPVLCRMSGGANRRVRPKTEGWERTDHPAEDWSKICVPKSGTYDPMRTRPAPLHPETPRRHCLSQIHPIRGCPSRSRPRFPVGRKSHTEGGMRSYAPRPKLSWPGGSVCKDTREHDSHVRTLRPSAQASC